MHFPDFQHFCDYLILFNRAMPCHGTGYANDAFWMQRKITIWRYLFSVESWIVDLLLLLLIRCYSRVSSARISLVCPLYSLIASYFLLQEHRKIVRFHALFPLYQIYCMYRLKFIHINHIINTHLQCTKKLHAIFAFCSRAHEPNDNAMQWHFHWIALHCIQHTRTYTKYDKSNACNFKLFGSATVIYSIFNAFRAECNARKSHKSQSMHNQWKYFKINYKRKLCGVDKRENAVANKFERFSFRYFKFRFLSYPLDIDPIFARFKILFIFFYFCSALLCIRAFFFFSVSFCHCLSIWWKMSRTTKSVIFFNATNHGQTTTFKRYKMKLKRSSDNENLLAWKCFIKSAQNDNE